MDEAPEGFDPAVEADWRKALTEGEAGAGLIRAVFRRTPSSPRCGMCYAPFKGPGGPVARLLGFRPSRKNPLMCQRCFEEMPLGGAEVETGVLFADVRGFTTWSEDRAPQEVAALMNRLYRMATHVLAQRSAVIDKLSGDGVMALFVPGFAGKDYVGRMVDAADALVRGAGYGTKEGAWLPLAVGIDWGNAYVGNVGADESVKDFTALGDVVNTASRLQGQAQAGQIVMSERVYEQAAERYPGAQTVELELKGKSGPVAARVVDLSISAPMQ